MYKKLEEGEKAFKRRKKLLRKFNKTSLLSRALLQKAATTMKEKKNQTFFMLLYSEGHHHTDQLASSYTKRKKREERSTFPFTFVMMLCLLQDLHTFFCDISTSIRLSETFEIFLILFGYSLITSVKGSLTSIMFQEQVTAWMYNN